ncbi:MAG: hypothetical protein AAGD43_18220 [Pseudomonadota bacterium]
MFLDSIGMDERVSKNLHKVDLALWYPEHGYRHPMFEPEARSPNAPTVRLAEQVASLCLVLCVECRHVLFEQKLDDACKHVADYITFSDVLGNAEKREQWKFLKNRRRDFLRSLKSDRTYGDPAYKLNLVYRELVEGYEKLLCQGKRPEMFPIYYAMAKQRTEIALHELRMQKRLPHPNK